MIDLRKLTKILLVGLAIYAIVQLAQILIFSAPFMVMRFQEEGTAEIEWLIPLCSLILYLTLIVYFLLYRADKWAAKIVKNDNLEDAQPKVSWLPIVYRLVAVSCGILYLYWIVPLMISTLHAHLMMSRQDVLVDTNLDVTLNQFLTWVILLALGIYLLCGAPHFVRWQVKKTLECCSQSTEVEANQRDRRPL